MQLLELPTEILLLIFENLSAEELAQISHVDWTLRAIVEVHPYLAFTIASSARCRLYYEYYIELDYSGMLVGHALRKFRDRFNLYYQSPPGPRPWLKMPSRYRDFIQVYQRRRFRSLTGSGSFTSAHQLDEFIRLLFLIQRATDYPTNNRLGIPWYPFLEKRLICAELQRRWTYNFRRLEELEATYDDARNGSLFGPRADPAESTKSPLVYCWTKTEGRCLHAKLHRNLHEGPKFRVSGLLPKDTDLRLCWRTARSIPPSIWPSPLQPLWIAVILEKTTMCLPHWCQKGRVEKQPGVGAHSFE